ncbi:Actin protein 10 [Fasciola gigantica]|uniref:Actin protein 10 n=1 Tax=Fasciola gigantica TaxID=46835 RepID=A0A504YS57_FASGI|nr:Actin protein 10 [Fasciola gigantica]
MTIPVYEGYTLLNAWQAGQLGSHAIYKNLEQLLRENATVVNENGDALPLSSCTSGDCLLSTEVLEDIIARTAFISPASRAADWRNWLDAQSDPETANKVESPKVAEDAFYYPLNNLKGSKRLLIPSRIRELSVECLFTGDSDKITLATLLLQSILLSPIDIRRTLAQNIVVIGGTVNIPGFTCRLVEELNACLDWPEFASLSALKGEFRVHQPPGEPNYIAWLGGAIFGALESLPGRSLERNAYLEKGELPDWTSAIDAPPQISTGRTEATRH